jgi:O-antigen ligase
MSSSPVFEYEWRGPSGATERRRTADRWLARSVCFFLIIFVVAAPHSIAITQIAYSVALFLWVIRCLLGGASVLPQRLAWPLLAFLLLSAASAAFSFSPAESWAQMKKVPLLLVAVLWFQNIISLRQVKWLVNLLIASCLLSVAYTGWQYTFGIGAKVGGISPTSSLARQGLQESDILSRVGGHRVREREQLLRTLADPELPPTARLTVLRGVPQERIYLDLDRASVSEMRAKIASGELLVSRGHPLRAQGFYDHYVTYADVLVQIALLAFGLFVTCPRRDLFGKLLLGLTVLGMTSALWLTLTRAVMVSFLGGCLLVVFLASRGSARVAMVGFTGLALIVGGLLLQRNRGLGWVSLQSPEAQYRLLMWRDGLRLIRQYPWLGIGMGSLKDHWQELRIEAYQEFPLRSHFHSSPMQIAVERGLLTLAAWVWFLVGYFHVLWKLLRKTAAGDWHVRALVLGLGSAACAFLLASLTDYNWGDSEAVMIFWMFVGWVLALERLIDQGRSRGALTAAGESHR